MIKYLGSKRVLVPLIVDVMRCFPEARSVLDVFSGTARVGHALKREGYRVVANDHNRYAHALAGCYVAADLERVERSARRLIEEFNRLPGAPGYFTETFCERARFFQPRNGARIDAIRERIAALDLPRDVHDVVLVSLMEAADRVDSTTGVQMAYLKDWAPRAFNDLQLRMPDVVPRARHGPSEASCLDAEAAIAAYETDIAYLDPPYNQHKYLGNYHIWETLVRWDKPEVYGTACKRVDCRERRSDFNSKPRCLDALRRVVRGVRAPLVVLSFNNEGYVGAEDIASMLAERGPVAIIETDYKRYVGAKIGIYNPSGEKVGKISHLRNKEYLYIAGDLSGCSSQGLLSESWQALARAHRDASP